MPIRVAQVVRPAAGGIRRHVSLLSSHLHADIYSPTVYAPPGFTLDESAARIPLRPVDIAPSTQILKDILAIVALSRQLWSRADIVHAHGLRAAAIAVPAAARAGIPAIFTAHNIPPTPGKLQKVVLNRIFQSASSIIAVSQAVRNGLLFIGANPDRIIVIPNGIPLEEFDSPTAGKPISINLTPESKIVACVGRLSAEKGVDVLIRAFRAAQVLFPSSQLLIIGDGPELCNLQQLAKGTPGISFLGFRTDLPDLMAKSTVVVVPSRSEGQGIAAIEAMASGKPVIASRVGGLPETVIDGECGILVASENEESLSKAIIDLLGHADKADTFGKAGRKRAHAEYSIETMIDRIESEYARLVAVR